MKQSNASVNELVIYNDMFPVNRNVVSLFNLSLEP